MSNFNIKSISKFCKKHKIAKIINIFMVFVSISVLGYFCLSNNNLMHLLSELPNMNAFWLSGAFLCIILSWIFDSLCIFELIKSSSKNKITWYESFKITLIGQYFTALSPMGIASQPMQTIELKKSGLSLKTAASVITRKFLIYQLVLSVYSIANFGIYLTIAPEKKYIFFILSGLIFQSFMVSVLLIFSINKKLVLNILGYILKILKKIKIIKNDTKFLECSKSKLDFFVKCNKSLSQNKKSNQKIYLYNFCQITFLFSVPFFVFKAFNHAEFPIIKSICFQSVINTLSSYTPLPGSAGTAEKSFVDIFSWLFSSYTLKPAMIACRLISLYFGLVIGAAVYYISRAFNGRSSCNH